MKTIKSITSIISISTLMLCGLAQSASAQDVNARISTRETYVGMPVVLQVSINNASDYQQPTAPEIDGCDVRTAGTPSQSSQITIINGRRSASRSVTMRYLITPRREGTFEIPSLTVKVDGRDQKTEPFRFVATKSETGDLLFVEIEGGKDKVFVGQPLDLTLKIWIKPFVDRQHNIKLSVANMWQMISEQTSWGSFADRLRELAENNQRPGGREELHDDGHGNERSYYLYEIDATVYPKRPGRIDADDVQIVVNYPTALGKSRDPFEEMFGDNSLGGFGGGSPLSRMMRDDFFSSSPFGNRLSVSSTRPVVAESAVDSTEVVPVPTTGRPADYRGAVGRYRIVTQATPTAVSAGDPITLSIGIAGTGPMELVQAPPLSELSSLTGDFKVADQSLAGFVKGDTKVFSTTIRPRREGITAIPPIPFSFFDPATEKFETATSEPISITVGKSESLALDAIVGNARRGSGDAPVQSTVGMSVQPDFSNINTLDVLISQSPNSSGSGWLLFVVVPPFVWLISWLVRQREWLANQFPNIKSANAQCLAEIERAVTRQQIENALVYYIARRTGRSRLRPRRRFRQAVFRAEPQPPKLAALNLEASLNEVAGGTASLTRRVTDSRDVAVGALRTCGLYQVANQVEHFIQNNAHSAFNGSSERSLVEDQQAARELVERMETEFTSMKKSQVRRSSRRNSASTDAEIGATSVRRRRKATHTTPMFLIAGLIVFSATASASAIDPTDNSTSIPLVAQVTKVLDSQDVPIAGGSGENGPGAIKRSVKLNDSQRKTILVEAGKIYANAVAVADTDAAEANELFTTAADKYRLLVDSGVRNSQLYLNLANAYLRSNQLGHAIANYERAKSLDPTNRQISVNLEFANSLVQSQGASSAVVSANAIDGSTSLASLRAYLQNANESLTGIVGNGSIIWTLAISSVLFWGLLTAAVWGDRFPLKRLAMIPLVVLLVSAASFLLTATAESNQGNGIIVANNVTLHSGDGEQFDKVISLETAQGHQVQILNKRGNWTQIQTSSGHTGWVKNENLESNI